MRFYISTEQIEHDFYYLIIFRYPLISKQNRREGRRVVPEQKCDNFFGNDSGGELFDVRGDIHSSPVAVPWAGRI